MDKPGFPGFCWLLKSLFSRSTRSEVGARLDRSNDPKQSKIYLESSLWPPLCENTPRKAAELVFRMLRGLGRHCSSILKQTQLSRQDQRRKLKFNGSQTRQHSSNSASRVKEAPTLAEFMQGSQKGTKSHLQHFVATYCGKIFTTFVAFARNLFLTVVISFFRMKLKQKRKNWYQIRCLTWTGILKLVVAGLCSSRRTVVR